MLGTKPGSPDDPEKSNKCHQKINQHKFSGALHWESAKVQKIPRVRKIRVRNSGAGNGCANFMGAWKNAFFLQENLHVHKIPRFRGGGILGFFGGGSVDFIFMGAGIFLKSIAQKGVRAIDPRKAGARNG